MTRKRFFIGLILFLIFVVLLDRIVGSILEYGIYKHFDLYSKVDYLVIGSSPATLDLNKSMLEQQTGCKFAFYAQLGVTSEDRLMMIKHFLSINKSHLKGVIYELTPHIFTYKGLSDNSYQLLYPYIGDKVIKDYLQGKCASKFEYYEKLLFSTSRFNEMTLDFAIRGLLNNHSNLKFGVIDTVKLQNEIAHNNFWKISMDSDCIKTFRNTVLFLKQKNTKGIFVFYPIISTLTKAEPNNVNEVERIVSEMIKINTQNELKVYTHVFDNKPSLFFDHLHLNVEGQKEFTKIFIFNSMSCNESYN